MKTYKSNLIKLIVLCLLLPILTINGQAPEAYIISLWTFDRAQRFEKNEQIPAEHNQPIEEGILRMIGGEVKSSGTEGVPFTDFTCGIPYAPTAGIQWDEVEGGEDIRTDLPAQLELSISTIDWKQISLFFYYRSERTKSFDVSYHLGDGDWKLVADDVVIDPRDEWTNIGVGLNDIEDIENRALVVFLIHDFTRDFGSGEFRMDNIAVMGKRISQANDCPPTLQTITPFTDVGVLLNVGAPPTYTGSQGFQFQVADDETPIDQLTILAITTDPNVINRLNLSPVDAANGIYQLDIGEPHGYSGVAEVILRIMDASGNSTETSIQYGVADLAITDVTHYHQGTAQASAGVALDDTTMIVANDSDQRLSIYLRNQSSAPLATFDITDNLELSKDKDGSVQSVNIESAAKVGNRQYWLGSHSNDSRGNPAPNTYRLFATEVAGQGANAQLSFIGHYDDLFDDLDQWGDAYNYRFQRTINRGTRPINDNGFKIEGFTIAPDGQTAYIGMRTPLVPPDERNRALIVPIENFTAWFNNGNPSNAPTLGEPILLDLGGSGIRGLECNANGCAIVAGSIDTRADFSLYTWDGNRDSAPALRNVILDGLRPESVLLSNGNTFASGATVQLISDSDEIDWYRSGYRGDNLALNLQLFRSDVITLD